MVKSIRSATAAKAVESGKWKVNSEEAKGVMVEDYSEEIKKLAKKMARTKERL